MKKLLCLILLATLLCGCSDDKKGGDEQPTTTAEENESKDNEKVEEEYVLEDLDYEFDIIGYEKPNNVFFADKAGDVEIALNIKAGDKIGKGYVWDIRILEHNDEHIIVQYLIASEEPAEQFSYYECEWYETHLTIVNAKNNKVRKDIVFDEYVEFEKLNDAILCKKYGEITVTYSTYDLTLKELINMEVNDYSGAEVSRDGKRIYYVYEDMLYVYDSEKDEEKRIDSNGKYIALEVINVYADDEGNDYVFFNGIAGDFEEYQFILNANSGEVVYMVEGNDRLIHYDKPIYMEDAETNDMVNEAITQWIIGISKDKAYSYQYTEENKWIDKHILENKNLLYGYQIGDNTYLELYDYKTGNMVDSACIENMYGFIEWVSLCKDGSILLNISNIDNYSKIYKWNINNESAFESKFEVTEHEMGSMPSVDISGINGEIYGPGVKEVSERLQPLKERADRLEEQYGIEIYIGEEVGNYVTGYKLSELYYYNSVEDALEVIEEEMSRYPKGFFKQFECDEYKGFKLFISSYIERMAEGTVFGAGGLTNPYCGDIRIYVSSMEADIKATFNHELWHAIEFRCMANSEVSDKLDMDWDSLNPEDFTYKEISNDIGLGNAQYIYEYGDMYDMDINNVYFISEYGTTNNLEDKATIFQSLMADSPLEVDFDSAPHLKAKLKFMIECMESSFDTSDWPDMPWDEYMD